MSNTWCAHFSVKVLHGLTHWNSQLRDSYLMGDTHFWLIYACFVGFKHFYQFYKHVLWGFQTYHVTVVMVLGNQCTGNKNIVWAPRTAVLSIASDSTMIRKQYTTRTYGPRNESLLCAILYN